MSERPTRKVAVVLERTPVSSPWATHQWQAASVMADVGGEPRVLLEREGVVQKVFPGFEVALFRDESEGYYLNMSSDAPCAFVSVRTDEEGSDPYPFQVTLSYNEAARWMDGGERVDKAAIDLEFAAWMGAWVEENYRPEPKKRQRPKSFEGKEGRLRERGVTMAEENFLSRWSRRKTLAKSADREAAPPAPGAAPPAPAAGETREVPAEPAPLPPVESLTPESDFAPFMAPEVDGDVRRKALRTLFADPHFNTMDMMDVYVDDYSRPDPLPASWLDKLGQLSRLGDRAGRDREEAERRRALAEAGQAPTPGPEARQAPEAASGAEPETASAAEPEAPPPAADTPPGDAGIPPPPIGKSGP